MRPMPRQPQNPTLTRDLLALADVYVTIGWLALQRMRFGSLWPWDVGPRGHTRPTAQAITPVTAEDKDDDRVEAA